MKKSNSTRKTESRNRKTRKSYERSVIYDMLEDRAIKTKKLFHGKPFFRKLYPKIKKEDDLRHVEKQIVEILMEHPHPNIATFYQTNDRYLDIELLDTEQSNIHFNYPAFAKAKPQMVEVMKEVKDFLQGLGIMYIDWKFDNIGKNKDGQYKLFDFDSSGIIDTDTNEWKITPPDYWSYRNAIEKSCMTPKEIDDWSFEYNIVQNKTVSCKK
jgi:hypothetical protein